MWITDKYIDYVREQTIENPGQSWGRMLLGFQANKLRTKLLPKKEISKGYQKLEALMMSFVADSLCRPDSYVWGNIFSPCEIMQCFGLSTLSIECLSCYLSGYRLEDYFIDYAQNTGIAPTLCSYHKTFVGAIDSGAVPAPQYAVTTSLSCDGNLNTFRYLEKKKGVPFTFLDVPYGDDEASVDYLAGQLRDFAGELERICGEQLRILGGNKNREQLPPARDYGRSVRKDKRFCLQLNGEKKVYRLNRQPDDLPEKAAFHAEIYRRTGAKYILWDASSAVRRVSWRGEDFSPYLEDLVQIAGTTVRCADGHDPANAAKKLAGRNAVLICGEGAFCIGKTKDDVGAVADLLEKGCKAALFAENFPECKPLGRLDGLIQRIVYVNKYSRKKEE